MLTKRPLRDADLKLYEDLSSQIEGAIPKQFPLVPLPYGSVQARCAIQSDNLFVGIELSNGRYIFDPRLYAMGVYSYGDYLALIAPQANQCGAPICVQQKLTLEPEIIPTQSSSRSGIPDMRRVLILGPRERSQRIYLHLSRLGIDCVFFNERLNEDIICRLGTFDLVITNGYPFRLQDEVIHRLGCRIINVHVTYLPWGRGIGTIFYAAILDQPTGISLHRIDSHAIDSGPILLRRSVSIDQNLTTREAHTMLTMQSEHILIDSFVEICDTRVKEHPNRFRYLDYSPPYFSRYNFESLIRFFPLGYDTKIGTLKEFGKICMNNYSFNSPV